MNETLLSLIFHRLTTFCLKFRWWRESEKEKVVYMFCYHRLLVELFKCDATIHLIILSVDKPPLQFEIVVTWAVDITCVVVVFHISMTNFLLLFLSSIVYTRFLICPWLVSTIYSLWLRQRRKKCWFYRFCIHVYIYVCVYVYIHIYIHKMQVKKETF